MSTILKTLKKLEKEKNDLQKNLDLKEMVLQGDSPAYLQSKGIEKKVWLFAGMTVCGVLMGAVIAFLYLESNGGQFPKTGVPLKASQIQKSEFEKKPSSQLGFSLSAIPESEEVEKPEPPVHEQLAAKESIDSVPANIVSNLKERPVAEQVEEKHMRPPTGSNVSTDGFDVSAKIEQGTIDGVKIKGIIFFSADSPSNHIFVSTKTENNKKLRIGDSISGATLKNVRPNEAVFSINGKLLTMELGG